MVRLKYFIRDGWCLRVNKFVFVSVWMVLFSVWFILLPCVLSGGIVICGLTVSGKGVVSGCPRSFGIWVSCSRSIILLSVLIIVTRSMEGNFVLGFPTCFSFLLFFVNLLEICGSFVVTYYLLEVRSDFSWEMLFVCILVQCWGDVVCWDMFLSATIFFSM